MSKGKSSSSILLLLTDKFYCTCSLSSHWMIRYELSIEKGRECGVLVNWSRDTTTIIITPPIRVMESGENVKSLDSDTFEDCG